MPRRGRSPASEHSAPNGLTRAWNHVRTRLLGAFAILPLLVVAGVAVARYWPHDPPAPLPPPRRPILPDLAMPPLSGRAGRECPGRRRWTAVLFGEHHEYRTRTVCHQGGPRRRTRCLARLPAIPGARWRPERAQDIRGHGLGRPRTRPLARTDRRVLQVVCASRAYVWFAPTRRWGTASSIKSGSIRISPTHQRDRCSRKTPATGARRSALEMGLSPGWQDPYTWLLPDQRLDITGLPDGKYRLVAKADPNNWFRETDERNNVTWVDLALRTNAGSPRVTVEEVGPHATPGGP